jgi:hypothetical protein
MSGPNALLAGLLLIAALLAATDLYAIVIRRRERGRRDVRQAQADQESGWRSLVRLGLVDRPRPIRSPDEPQRRSTSRWVQRWRGLSSAPSINEDSSTESDPVVQGRDHGA